MKQSFAKFAMKPVIKPAGLCWLNPHGPVDCGETLIVRTLKPCEVMKVGVAHGPETLLRPGKSQPRSHERSHNFPSRLITDDSALWRAAGEVSPIDFTEAWRIVFPMPRFVLVGIPAEFLAAQEQPLVHG